LGEYFWGKLLKEGNKRVLKEECKKWLIWAYFRDIKREELWIFRVLMSFLKV